jgi:hypothetical protein
MSGKGDKRRPAQVPREQVDEDYDRIFKKEKCGYANRYKAERPPTCGCRACEAKWNQK